jgi:hypothetical protein
MVLTSLTKIDEQGNLFFSLPGVLALSLSHEEVRGRFFLFGGNPLPDHGVLRWQGRDPEEAQSYRLSPLLAEDSDLPDGAVQPYGQLASEIFSDFPSASAQKPASVMGSQLFLLPLKVINVISEAQNPASYVPIDGWTIAKTASLPAREFVCRDRLRLHEFDFNCRAAPLETLEGLSRDLPWSKRDRATSPILVVAVTSDGERYLPIVSKGERIV